MHLPSRCLLFVAILLTHAGKIRAGDTVDFSKQIQPLFEKHCVSCHGPTKKKAGLRLDLGKKILAGSPLGPVIVVGKSTDSKLIHKLKGEGNGERMPPDGELTDAEIQLIAKWINAGAIIPQNEVEKPVSHWAFVSPKPQVIPVGVNPIDHFLALERTKRGIVAAPPADSETLLRRLCFDLTGLPPTPEQLQAFRLDKSDKAYERQVDSLLASPQYGERWARHFLDLWRYSDWYGYGNELRNSQKHIWNWRDWVVESLNENKSYNRMIQEMLAADELEPANTNTLRATGYLARNYYKFNRNVWLDDIVEHTGKAFLGLTLNCCRCHDHMYDPISQEEYFRFRAIFEPHQIRLDPVSGEPDPEKRGLARVYDADLSAVTYLFERGDEKRPVKTKPILPGVPSAVSTQAYVLREITRPVEAAHPTLSDGIRKELIERAEKQVEQAKGTQRIRAAVLNLQTVKAKLVADRARYTKPPAKSATDLIRHAVVLQCETAALNAEADLFDAEQALKAIDAKTKNAAKSIEAQTKKVAELKKQVDMARKACETPPADYIALVASYPDKSTGRRLALANWITSKENPLTARVLVNHVWLRHFGQPLVPTVFDFGMNGRPRSHPELLDALAFEFLESNGDLKALHRRIVTSQSYRMQSTQSGAVAEENRRRDPDNIWYGRMLPRPLEAEAIRDSLLAVSNLLDPKLGGPELDFNEELPLLRRSLYYRHAPEKMMPFLTAFDAAGPTECYRRATTIVPQQAMALVNSRLSVRAAEAVVKKLGERPVESFITDAYRLILCREPTDSEASICQDFLKSNTRDSLIQALFNHVDFTTIR